MSEVMMYTSLADLAGMDTTDVKVLRSRLQKEGIYVVRLTAVEMSEASDGSDGKDVRLSIRVGGDVLDFRPLKEEDQADAQDMVGRAFNQIKPFFPKDMAEQIGLLKGSYQAAHLSVTGRMGGVPGIEGWLDRAVGSIVVISVKHREYKEDTRVYYNWLGVKAVTALGIDWESEIGREPVDQHDNVLDIQELLGKK